MSDRDKAREANFVDAVIKQPFPSVNSREYPADLIAVDRIGVVQGWGTPGPQYGASSGCFLCEILSSGYVSFVEN